MTIGVRRYCEKRREGKIGVMRREDGDRGKEGVIGKIVTLPSFLHLKFQRRGSQKSPHGSPVVLATELSLRSCPSNTLSSNLLR